MAVLDLSFVVPAHNEERVLGVCLASLAAAAADVGCRHEIIVVDDASTDRTAAIATAAGARVVSVERRQIAAARNAGAAVAATDRLVFVDADTLLPAEVLRAALAELDAGAVGGGAGVRFDEPVPRHARVVLTILVRVFRRLRLAAGCFVFADRAAFEAVGGFDETYFAAEEIALSRALRRRGRFVVVPSAVVTSGRKVRGYSLGTFVAMLGRLGLQGRRSVRDRDGLEMWYSDTRRDQVVPRLPGGSS